MKSALIVGSAPCVFDDLEAAPRWPLIVINFAGLRHLGPIEFWASLHFRLLCDLISDRERMGGDMNFTAYAKIPPRMAIPKFASGVKIVPAPLKRIGNGSSGLVAAVTAIRLGYERLVLCGVPLEGGHTIQADQKIQFRGTPKVPAFAKFRRAWELHQDIVKPHVRSMSGWTREFLGGPDEPIA